MSNKSFNLQRLVFFVLLIAGMLIAGFYYVRHRHDQQLAAKVYQQLVVIDHQLDELALVAESLNQQRNATNELISTFKNTNVTNLEQQKPPLLRLLASVNYESAVGESLPEIVRNLNATNFKQQRKDLVIDARKLNYWQKIQINAFNQRLDSLTTQLPPIKAEVMQIEGSNLQELELAKLKFIIRKLRNTAEIINHALFQELGSSLLETLHRYHESETADATAN